MSEAQETGQETPTATKRAAYFLALVLVVMGMAHSTPTIPGWDELWRAVSGDPTLKVRAFKTEYFFPLSFFVMMLMVALSHSMWREWWGQRKVWFGAFMDIALIIAAAAISLNFISVWVTSPRARSRRISR